MWPIEESGYLENDVLRVEIMLCFNVSYSHIENITIEIIMKK